VAQFGANGSELAETRTGGAPAGSGLIGVTQVRFSGEDLARTRFAARPAPLVEAVLALAERRHRPGAQVSQRPGQAVPVLPVTALPLLDLVPAAGYWPEFLDPAVPDLDEGLEMVRATPRHVLREQLARCWQSPARPPVWLRALADGHPEALERVRRGLRDLYAAWVAPRWPAIMTSFRADVGGRVPALAASGLTGVFPALHPALAWRGGVLERTWRTAELTLDGHGLQLVPSTSWTGPPLFSLIPWEPGYSALIYPARPAAACGAALAPDLAGLLGRTRAAVLESLRDPCGTSHLAARLAISAASASEHVTALRRAGLAQTARSGRTARHALTPLGQSLLTRH
jgi:DNA-binding transcriptional ArsR family regulator